VSASGQLYFLHKDQNYLKLLIWRFIMFKQLIILSICLSVGLLSLLIAATLGSVIDNEPIEAVSVTTLEDNSSATRLSVEVTDWTMQQARSGDKTEHNIIGQPTTVREGWPELPMITRVVRIPPTTGIRLEINRIDSHIDSDYRPFIVPPQDGTVSPDDPGIPSREYLQYNEFWPPAPVVVGEPAILRGHRLVQVTIFPMQ